jgi:lipopolysaccharide cholinephosphotransferase
MRKLSQEEYKKVLLSILTRIDTVCRENGLRYMLAYGTLLGAVRHKGFIPWDDDVDIVMFPEDYVKLREILNSEDFGLVFLDPVSCPSTIFPFGKICDNSTIINEGEYKHVEGYGAFIDVFPLTYISDNPVVQKKISKKYRNIERIIQHSALINYGKTNSVCRNISKILAFYFSKLFNTQILCRKVYDFFFSMNNIVTNHVCVLWGAVYNVDLFNEIIDMEFEGQCFAVPAKYDEVLKVNFGDYMKLPPEEERVNKHDIECYSKN